MSIFEIVCYDNANPVNRNEWVRSDRYEYCDELYESVSGKKKSGVFHKFSALLLTRI